MLGNAQVKLSWWQTAGAMDFLVRNADGDQLLFVHQGEGDLFCDYGHLPVKAGDYLYAAAWHHVAHRCRPSPWPCC